MARKKSLVLLCLLCGLLIMPYISYGGSEAKKVIRITSGEWPPYHSKNYKEKDGFVLKLIEQIYNEAGIKVEFGFFPWARSYKLVEEGDWNALASWEPENVPNLFYSDPISSSNYVFYHLKSRHIKWKGWSDKKSLKGKVVGTTLGYTYGKEFEKAVKEGLFIVEEAKTDALNYKKLLAKRIDLFPNGKYAGYYMLKEHFSDAEIKKLTFCDQVIRPDSFNLVFTSKKKENKYFAEVFNKGWKKLEKEGVLKKYLDNLKVIDQ